jgi:allophanate hydrolase
MTDVTSDSFGAVTDLPFTLPSLRAAYVAGLSPEAVAAESLRRIAASGDPGMFISLTSAEALAAEARALGAFDPDRPLWGVPVAVKDNIDVAGLPTTAACPAWEYLPERDAFVVAQLRAAGALIVGKTNLDQFATGLVGVRTPYPVPINALDPEIVPGGSSSGSGVAVARGCVALALGTDTAGSGRVPAGLNNIVGLKPSLGALSSVGVVPACATLDTVSVFALTVADAWAGFAAMAVPDPEDARGRPAVLAAPSPLPAGIRIGIPDAGSIRFFGDAAQAEMFIATCDALALEGATLVPIDFAPLYDVAQLLYDGPWVAERHTVIAELMASYPEAVDPTVRGIVGKALGISATDTFRGLYRLTELRHSVRPVLASVDLLCVPTFPTFYSRADLAADPVGPNSRFGTYTNFVNLLDMCGLAVPTPARRDGRPGSVTLLAPAGKDRLLADIGSGIEAWGDRTLGATGWARPAAPAPDPAAGPDEAEIAVCGAHLAGLPLNHQLTSRRARFLRATTSTPDYRFYALPGGPPERPGMVRVADGTGGAIAVEVWAIPLAELGSFLSGIPAPLGLGRVRLADGTSPIGFVCEAAATDGARDITAIGDWRRYLAGA